MIRKFKISDIKNFTPNQHSGLEDVSDVLEGDEFFKYSQIVDGKVVCLICAKGVGNGEYGAFFLMAEGYNPMHGRELKLFIQEVQQKLDGKRLFTLSRDCELLNKWHNFLGFKVQQEKYQQIAGEDFNLWQIVWG